MWAQLALSYPANSNPGGVFYQLVTMKKMRHPSLTSAVMDHPRVNVAPPWIETPGAGSDNGDMIFNGLDAGIGVYGAVRHGKVYNVSFYDGHAGGFKGLYYGWAFPESNLTAPSYYPLP